MSTIDETVVVERSLRGRVSIKVRVTGAQGSLTAKIVEVRTRKGQVIPESDWPDSEEVGLIGVEAIEGVERRLAPNPAPAPQNGGRP